MNRLQTIIDTYAQDAALQLYTTSDPHEIREIVRGILLQSSKDIIERACHVIDEHTGFNDRMTMTTLKVRAYFNQEIV